MKYLKLAAQAFTLLLFISTTAFSMKTGDRTGAISTADSFNQVPIQTKEIKNYINSHIDGHIHSFKDPNLYPGIVKHLQKKQNHEYEQTLLKFLTKSYFTPEGMQIDVLSNEDFYNQNTEGSIFHGTHSTLEIFNDWKLKPYLSKSGYGVFFGRDNDGYYTASQYAGQFSSNIHRTYGTTPVQSVLVFRKDREHPFVTHSAGWFGGVKEFILEKDYPLEFLHSIVFMDKDDSLKFSHWLNEHPDLKEKSKSIHYYDRSYQPLSDEPHFNLVKAEFYRKKEEIYKDLNLIAEIVTSAFYEERGKENLQQEYVTLLRMNAERDFGITRTILRGSFMKKLKAPVQFLVDQYDSIALAQLIVDERDGASILEGAFRWEFLWPECIQLLMQKIENNPTAMQIIDHWFSSSEHQRNKEVYIKNRQKHATQDIKKMNATDKPKVTSNALRDIINYLEDGNCVVLRSSGIDQVYYQKDQTKDPIKIRFVIIDVTGTGLEHSDEWPWYITDHFRDKLDERFWTTYRDFYRLNRTSENIFHLQMIQDINLL